MDALGNQGMKDIVRTGFPGNAMFRKLPLVPLYAFVKLQIEKMDFFGSGGGNFGVLNQVIIEGGGTAFLTADDDEVGLMMGHTRVGWDSVAGISPHPNPLPRGEGTRNQTRSELTPLALWERGWG